MMKMTQMSVLCCIFYAFVCVWIGQVNSINFPSRLPGTVYSSVSTCPPQDTINEEHRKARDFILNNFNSNPPSSCGGPGWTRVAYLNMTETNQQCPSNWTLTTSPVRGCGQSSSE